MKCDVVIIGGGAAGLLCAFTAGKRGRSVVLLERASRVGNKILISGGGRCNFTNAGTTSENFVTSGSPHFCKSALARFTPEDFLALVEKHRIAWHEKKLGQLFCDFSSRQIVRLLEAECAAATVDIRLNVEVAEVRKQSHFFANTSAGTFESDSLVIATGGLSYPKLGATPFGYRIAEQFGLHVVPPRPGLVPLTFSPQELAAFAGLSGVSVDVETSVQSSGARFRENMLFTHRGLSGPAILQISSHTVPGEPVHIDLLPGEPAQSLFEEHRHQNRDLRIVLGRRLPQRFADAWCRTFVPSRPTNQISDRDLGDLATRLHDWQFLPAGDEGYAKAEVTRGGVDTAELSSQTMGSRRVPGLYFIGEVVDVTGWLGGYNFQWAWASGNAAGDAV
jgi:predicted Rossmann fold flavoprotein